MAHTTKLAGWMPWRVCGRLLPVCAGLLIGCTPDSLVSGNDPLIGGPPYRPTTAIPVAANNPPRRDGSVPPIPGPPSAGGNAVLAGGSSGPGMDPSRNLQLGPTPGTLTSNPGTTGAGNWSPPAGGLAPTGGVTIGGPQPTGNDKESVVPGDSRGITAVPGVPVVPSAVSTGPTLEALLAQLTSRGVLYQQLLWPGEKSDWQFKCAVPSRSNSGESRVVETRGPDPVSAIKAALERIDSTR